MVICWVTPIDTLQVRSSFIRFRRYSSKNKDYPGPGLVSEGRSFDHWRVWLLRSGRQQCCKCYWTVCWNHTLEVAALVGGLSIGLGVLTSARGSCTLLESQIIQLDHFSAVIAVLAQAITVWIYALIGVPVSTSQAIVGAVIGAGLARGSTNINYKILRNIVLGWLQTPLIAGLVSVGLYLSINAIRALLISPLFLSTIISILSEQSSERFAISPIDRTSSRSCLFSARDKFISKIFLTRACS